MSLVVQPVIDPTTTTTNVELQPVVERIESNYIRVCANVYDPYSNIQNAYAFAFVEEIPTEYLNGNVNIFIDFIERNNTLVTKLFDPNTGKTGQVNGMPFHCIGFIRKSFPRANPNWLTHLDMVFSPSDLVDSLLSHFVYIVTQNSNEFYKIWDKPVYECPFQSIRILPFSSSSAIYINQLIICPSNFTRIIVQTYTYNGTTLLHDILEDHIDKMISQVGSFIGVGENLLGDGNSVKVSIHVYWGFASSSDTVYTKNGYFARVPLETS
jgi:hypothetical protein